MTVMIDTTGQSHEIRVPRLIGRLEAIGWTVKADTTVTTVKTPTTEREWDAIFGRR